MKKDPTINRDASSSPKDASPKDDQGTSRRKRLRELNRSRKWNNCFKQFWKKHNVLPMEHSP